ncbi:hypothetical protein ACWCXH_39035 [Kitasatospora sp. NPDC001660]
MGGHTWARATVYCRKGEAPGPQGALSHLSGRVRVTGRWVRVRPEGGAAQVWISAAVVQRIVWEKEKGTTGAR